jgi:hypothetical protein
MKGPMKKNASDKLKQDSALHLRVPHVLRERLETMARSSGDVLGHLCRRVLWRYAMRGAK